MKKRILSFILCALCFSLIACSPTQYQDDISCKTVAERICQKLPLANGYAAFGEERIQTTFPESALPADHAWLYSVDSADINEIGVFKAQNAEAAKETEAYLDAYLSDMQENDRAFIASYAPKELTKLDSAQIERLGQYVILCICPPEEIAECMDAAREALTK